MNEASFECLHFEFEGVKLTADAPSWVSNSSDCGHFLPIRPAAILSQFPASMPMVQKRRSEACEVSKILSLRSFVESMVHPGGELESTGYWKPWWRVVVDQKAT